MNLRRLISFFLLQFALLNTSLSSADGESDAGNIRDGLKVHLLMMNGDREEIPFYGFTGVCTGYGKEGIRYKGDARETKMPWSEIRFIVPRGGAGMLKNGKSFRDEALKPKSCKEAYLMTKKEKKVRVPGFKKEVMVDEEVKIPLKEIDTLAFSSGWLSDAMKASKRMITEDMVFVPGGCFKMGDIFGGGEVDERPVHEVCVNDYYIGRYEVSQREWKEVIGNNPSNFRMCDNCPVEEVRWNDVQVFIKKLNERKGVNYRLPTEAEWEYAARSGGKNEKWSGTSRKAEIGAYAWHGLNSGSKTHPVGQKKPNGLEIFDMSGNVWEWVSDWYGKHYYGESPEKNPKGPPTGVYKVFRGGGFYLEPAYLRTTLRFSVNPDYKNNALGFRLARTP